MPKPPSKEPTGIGLQLKQERIRLGLTQQQLFEKVPEICPTERISLSTIKQTEEGVREPTEKTIQLIKKTLNAAEIERYTEERKNRLYYAMMLIWDDNYDFQKTQQETARIITSNQGSITALALNPKLPMFYNKIIKSGLQASLINIRNKMLNAVIDEINSSQKARHGFAIISLTVGWGWFDIQLAREISRCFERQPVRLIMVTSSPYVEDQAIPEIVSSLRSSTVTPLLLRGYYESLDFYQNVFANTQERRIFLVLTPLSCQSNVGTFLDQIDKVSRVGDYLLIDIFPPFSDSFDPLTITRLDVRSNGEIDTSFADPVNQFFRDSVLNIFTQCAEISPEERTELEQENPKGLDVNIEVSDGNYHLPWNYKVQLSTTQPRRMFGRGKQVVFEFIRRNPQRVAAFLAQTGWRLIRSFEWGNDNVPRYPSHLMLFERASVQSR